MRQLNQPLCLALFLVTAGPVWAQSSPPSGREIMVKYKAEDRTRDSSIQLKMTLINARGGQRERQLSIVSKTDTKDNRKQLIRFLSPADVMGTGFLSIEHSYSDDDNWLYLPALLKTRRIAGSDKTDKFMGSEFTFEDLDSEDLSAYQYKLIGSDNLGGLQTWVLEAIPTDPKKIEETGYSKRELWISKDHYLVVQTKYYDKEGAYVKLLKAGEFQQVPGAEKWRAYYMSMADLHKGDKTILEFSEYKIDQGVQDSFFTERYLKRGR